MDSSQYQRTFLHHLEANASQPLEPALRQAFMDCPRHLFLPRYLDPQTRQWYDVTPENLEEHLPTLYADRSLCIYQQTDPPIQATISQPSLVLTMLQLLDIQPGASVFEIGTGSGWNAGLLGKLVGPQGHVYTMEILPELISGSQQALQTAGIDSVTVLTGDGAGGYPDGAPYDRIVFTAGTFDIPAAIHQQLKEDGLLLAVLKIPGGGDDLVLFKKEQGVLVSRYSSAVRFVPLLGEYHFPALEGMDFDMFLVQEKLAPEVVERIPFWWGTRVTWHLMEQTEGIRSFLNLSEPGYRVFTSQQPQPLTFFGLYDHDSQSLVIARDNELVSYGSVVARDKLLNSLGEWVRQGMHTSIRLPLRIYPKSTRSSIPEPGWHLERADSIFVIGRQ